MENLEMTSLFNGVYQNKKVFLTGHTGFKGSWLAFWLKKMGADVLGYSDAFPSDPNHFSLLAPGITSVIADINDTHTLNKQMQAFKPDVVFHLAAQPLVRYSYSQPLLTFQTNVLGTANVFEACRHTPSVKAIVNITSDKCYENTEQDVAYKETDRMGGYDPYSASKGCAELVVNSYRNSFFNIEKYKKDHQILLASGRAGNVIGGGDWAMDRLIPDIVKASAIGVPVTIRNPKATRPWQHVLEPLSGYLMLGQYLLEEKTDFADGWNFGPKNNETLTVEEVLRIMKNYWHGLDYHIQQNPQQPHEAKLLKLDCSKANSMMQWFPVWNTQRSIEMTAKWYKKYYKGKGLSTHDDLVTYIADAREQNIVWAN